SPDLFGAGRRWPLAARPPGGPIGAGQSGWAVHGSLVGHMTMSPPPLHTGAAVGAVAVCWRLPGRPRRSSARRCWRRPTVSRRRRCASPPPPPGHLLSRTARPGIDRIIIIAVIMALPDAYLPLLAASGALPAIDYKWAVVALS